MVSFLEWLAVGRGSTGSRRVEMVNGAVAADNVAVDLLQNAAAAKDLNEIMRDEKEVDFLMPFQQPRSKRDRWYSQVYSTVDAAS